MAKPPNYTGLKSEKLLLQKKEKSKILYCGKYYFTLLKHWHLRWRIRLSVYSMFVEIQRVAEKEVGWNDMTLVDNF